MIALGRLGWPLRRIESETGVRRQTPSAYLKPPASGSGRREPGTAPTPDKRILDAIDFAYLEKYTMPGAIKYPRNLGSPQSRAVTLEAVRTRR